MARFLAIAKRLSALFVLCAGASAAFGQSSSSSNRSVATGWNDPENVFASDNDRATAGALVVWPWSPYLYATGFSFSIPSNHVIDGIEVAVQRRRVTGLGFGNVTDLFVQLTKDGTTPIGDNKAKNGNWPTSDAYATYGGSTDLWGETWTADDINSPTFGISILTEQTSGLWSTAEINHIRITVYHHLSVTPITLAAFDAKLTTSGSVQVNWSTASEINNDYFTIERSADGEQYEAIGDVPGSGTTNVERYYSYEDRMPLPGRSYYRLKQTDYDGTFTYSPIVAVDNDLPRVPVLTVFPNPSNGAFVGIRLTGAIGVMEIPVEIYAFAGKLIATRTLMSNGESFLEDTWHPETPLSSGIYIVRAGPLTERLVVP
jgi:hypothetical protein